MVIQRKRSSLTSSTHAHLPEDLVVKEILPKLPVESLMRFNCVSKKWHDLITNDSWLASAHLRHHSKATKHFIIAARCEFFKKFSDYYFNFGSYYYKNRICLMQYDESKVVRSDISWIVNDDVESEIVGSSNGLVCVDHNSRRRRARESYDMIALWNPATRQWRNIFPLTPSHLQISSVALGFGFDELGKDYKVVRIEDFFGGMIVVQVFTTSSDCWREVKSISGYSLQKKSQPGVLIDGALYWLVEETSARRRSVLSINLHNEEFQIMDLPENRGPYSDQYGYDISRRYQLTKWKESLALLSFEDVNRCREDWKLFCDILVMRDNDFAEQVWTPFFWQYGPNFYGVWRDYLLIGDIYMQNLFFVDTSSPNQENWLKIGIVSEPPGWWFLNEAHDYVPSLVSVYPNQKENDGEIIG